jgi:18S rRNA (guanine1575-N7)-methyltransferase
LSDDYNFSVKRKRPEEIYRDVREYYDEKMISWYASSKSIMKTQEKMTIRALELLDLKEKDLLILDAGSGPGFTAMYLNERGYKTVALDLIPEFLNYYEIKDLNPIVGDMRYLPFRPKSFNVIISISALQWIFNELNLSKNNSKLKEFSKSLSNILKPKSRALFQFYPKSKELMEQIGRIIVSSSKLSGDIIIDNPDSPKKRKIFLLLKDNK